MQDHPRLARNGQSHNRQNGSHTHSSHDSGVSLWIAVATVIISLGVLLVFTQGQVKNGGGPFVITPPATISAYEASEL